MGNTLKSGPGKQLTVKLYLLKLTNKEGDCELVDISYNRPLHSRINMTSGITGNFHSVMPLKSGKYLVSCQKHESDRYSLYEFDPEKKSLGQVVYSDQVIM